MILRSQPPPQTPCSPAEMRPHSSKRCDRAENVQSFFQYTIHKILLRLATILYIAELTQLFLYRNYHQNNFELNKNFGTRLSKVR